MEAYHKPVLLHESVEGLNISPEGVYVDVTFGGGGHSKAILEKLGPNGKLYAFDQDKDALDNIIDDPRFTLIHQNFRTLKGSLRLYGVKEVDGILADLGVSSHQFDEADRGFSTRFEGNLDMRMNTSASLSAETVVNEYEENELKNLLWHYGEVKNSRKVAERIVGSRSSSPLKTIEQLKALLENLAPRHRENRFFAQVFQAIRIEVNDELGALKKMLLDTAEVIKLGGRLSVISYHSLEDRLVKRFIKEGKFQGEAEKDFYGNKQVAFKAVNRKLIIPSDEEIQENNRARSAKLRIAEKL